MFPSQGQELHSQMTTSKVDCVPKEATAQVVRNFHALVALLVLSMDYLHVNTALQVTIVLSARTHRLCVQPITTVLVPAQHQQNAPTVLIQHQAKQACMTSLNVHRVQLAIIVLAVD